MITAERYVLRVRSDADPATVETQVREALAAEGFGILTEIDVASTLRDKLGVELPPYRILGACNPPLAHRALQTDPDVGALLPCNVVVRAHPGGGSEIMAADPEAMLSVAGSELAPIAAEAKQRLQRALERVAGA